MANDLFTRINNAILDLQASEYQTFERPLKNLARLLQHEDLQEANKTLTGGLDLDAFLEGKERQSGMVGSDKLEWPEDPDKALGLTLLLIIRFAENPGFMANFGHQYFYSGRKIVSGIHAITRQLIIPFARDYKTYVQSQGETAARLVSADTNKVFIVHGHDEGALQTLARFLEKLGLEAIVLKERPNQGRTVIEKYEAYASEVGFAVVLLTPDDLASAIAETAQNRRARQNVIFELGYFAGRLGRGRVCLLRKGEVEMPSDLFGVIYTDMDAAEGWKAKLVAELRTANLRFDSNRMWA
jgi:hypothetical protein